MSRTVQFETPDAYGSSSLLTAAEAAARAGVDRSTISRWVSSGRLSPAEVVVGERRRYLFDPADLERAANSGPCQECLVCDSAVTTARNDVRNLARLLARRPDSERLAILLANTKGSVSRALSRQQTHQSECNRRTA